MTGTITTATDDKVADALRHSWVYHLPRWLWPYAQLARWERPIGWQLLMWPCWWSAALASLAPTGVPGQSGGPQLFLNASAVWMLFTGYLIAFFLGAFLMRGAGCTYNDLVDVDIDRKVERTRSRPLPSGRVGRRQAFIFLLLQAFGGFGVLLFLAAGEPIILFTGIASLALVAIYPFMKRITWWPQLFLGLAFSWGALMGWVVIEKSLSLTPLLLYCGSIAWVIGYDTIYAHQDREDDALVGVKSTARLFGEKSRMAISVLFAGALVLMLAAYAFVLGVPDQPWKWPAFLGLLGGAAHMAWQIRALDIHDGGQCLSLFKSNHTFGKILFAGLILSLLLKG